MVVQPFLFVHKLSVPGIALLTALAAPRCWNVLGRLAVAERQPFRWSLLCVINRRGPITLWCRGAYGVHGRLKTRYRRTETCEVQQRSRWSSFPASSCKNTHLVNLETSCSARLRRSEMRRQGREDGTVESPARRTPCRACFETPKWVPGLS